MERTEKRSVLTLIGCLASLAVLWAVLVLLGQDFWWEYPRTHAGVLVSLYYTAIAVCTIGLLASVVMIWVGCLRIAAIVAFCWWAWFALDLSASSLEPIVDEYWEVAVGRAAPASIRVNDETGYIELGGEITVGSAAKFKEVLAVAPHARVVQVSGPGGLIDEARWIARQIEARQMDTLIMGKCASACVDIFVAGRERAMHAKATVGLHSASSALDDPAGVEEANRAFSERLYRHGVEPRFLMVGTETPAEGLWVNTARQAYLAGLATRVIE